jgi:cytochrome P450
MSDARCPITLSPEPQTYMEYERRRTEGPITWTSELNGWAVVSFELCEEVEKDEETYAHPERRDLVDSDATYEMIQLVNGGPRSLILLQGEEHKQIHGRLARELARRMRACKEDVHRLANYYASRLDDRVDFVQSYAEVLPTAVITAVFGLPWLNDEATLRRARTYTAAIGAARETLVRDSVEWEQGSHAARELSAMLRPFVVERKEGPDSDLIASIWRMGLEVFPDWGAEDVVAQCRLLYFAGSNSSTHFVSNIGYVMATNPDTWEAMRSDPSLIPNLVEEVLRVVAPVQGRPRVATKDLTLGGTPIRKGEVLYLMNGAANRDPCAFSEPATLDIVGRARRHLTFNAGPRTCPGVPTARTEGAAVVETLLSQFSDMKLDEDAPPPRFIGRLNMGFSPLNVMLTRPTQVEAS